MKILSGCFRYLLLAVCITACIIVLTSCGSSRAKDNSLPGQSVQTQQDESGGEINNQDSSSENVQEDAGKETDSDLQESTAQSGTQNLQQKASGKTQKPDTSSTAALGSKTAGAAVGQSGSGGAKTSEPEKSSSPESGGSNTQAKADTVSISIAGPEDIGVILPAAKVELETGDTALSVLLRITRQNKIQMEYRGMKATAYIKGIDNIYEFDYGDKSGWLYRVNGAIPSKSIGVCTVKSGDKIELVYTVDLGKELAAGAGGGV